MKLVLWYPFIFISDFMYKNSEIELLEMWYLLCWQHNAVMRSRTCQIQLPLPLHAPRPARQKYSASVGRAVKFVNRYKNLVGSSVCEVILIEFLST